MTEKNNTDAKQRIKIQKVENENLIKKLVNEAMSSWKMQCEHEMNALKEEIKAINESQNFIADKHEKLKLEHCDLQMINKKQEKEIIELKAKSSNLKVHGAKEVRCLGTIWEKTKPRNRWNFN